MTAKEFFKNNRSNDGFMYADKAKEYGKMLAIEQLKSLQDEIKTMPKYQTDFRLQTLIHAIYYQITDIEKMK